MESSLFEYNQTIANYVIGEEIVANRPFIYNIETLDNYIITPELENGLNINYKTGIISGSPISSSGGIQKPYVISARDVKNAIIATTTIYIEVADFNLPYNIRFFKNDEELKTVEIHIVKGESLSIKTRNDGNATSYELLTQNIDGFKFDTVTGVYSGICLEEFSQEYLIAI